MQGDCERVLAYASSSLNKAEKIYCVTEIARWLEIWSQYDFSIEYRPGKKQGHCDALCRCENPRDCECPEQDTSQPLKCGPCKKCLNGRKK